MVKPVVKLSGLIKSGAVVAASAEKSAALPSFDFSANDTDPSSSVASSGTCMIPLSKLKLHPFNSRTDRTTARIEEVRLMLEAENIQREPITAVPGRRPEDQGYFYILSGQTRYHAALLAGWTELKAQINANIDPDDHLSFFSASIEHNTSRPETDWDLAVKVKALVEEGSDHAMIQKAVRRDERGLRRLLAMTDLDEAILQIVRANSTKLTAPFCEALRAGVSKLGTDVIALIAKKVAENDLSHRATTDLVELEIRRKTRATGGRHPKPVAQFKIPVLVGVTKAGEFSVKPSKSEGNRVVSLTADIPEGLIEAFKSDIEAAIVKMVAQHGAG